MTTKLTAITLALAMVSSSSLATSPATALRCVVQAPARAMVGQPVLLRFTVTNTGPTPLQVLRWNTPFEGAWFAPFVEVKRDGKALPFQGPMIKRAEPSAENYLRFDAGQSIDAELDLALPFDLSKPGHYRVQPRLRLIDVFVDTGSEAKAPRARSEHQGADLACPAVEFKLASPKG
ncbi:MAG TPA: hypothetical protein VFY73_20180 [Ideonella sp.]|uniref:hypothetical protein n=1 Tax=Ideonella sp. TaxID=1929293 RepID=UPI002E369C56|nr:hypothetical protein [Ideonella sp.]HEX5686353.1 hypothetical protein [Ideonella sp.]